MVTISIKRFFVAVLMCFNIQILASAAGGNETTFKTASQLTDEGFLKTSSQAIVDLQKKVYEIQNEVFWISFWCKAKWIFLPVPYIHGHYYNRCVATTTDSTVFNKIGDLERQIQGALPDLLPNSYEQNPLKKHLLTILAETKHEYLEGKAAGDSQRHKVLHPTPEQVRFYDHHKKVIEDLMNRVSNLQYQINATKWWCKLWMIPYLVRWCVTKYTPEKVISEYRRLKNDVNSLPDIPGMNGNPLRDHLKMMLMTEENEWLQQQLNLK